MKRRRPDPEDVIAGRARASAHDLFDLVHHCNPTGREFAPTEEARRYALKARLQSVLVRRFPDELRVVPEPGRDHLVSLVHRSGQRDACHAVIAQLDPDARAWVQRRLDEGPEAADTAPHPTRRDETLATGSEADDSPSALLQRARAALEGYDYEAARTLTEAALRRSPQDRDAGVLLLELLVEHLGADGEAAEAAGLLGPEAAADPRIRALLALAAGRLGDAARARRLIKGMDDAHAGAVFIALAESALRAGDEASAASLIGEARLRAPAGPDLPRLEQQRATLRAKRRRPLEDELERHRGAGRADEVEPLARKILAEWPESDVAGRVLRQIEDERRKGRAEALLDDSERALVRGDVAGARQSWNEAAALGGDRPLLGSRLEQAEGEQRQREEQDAMAHTLWRLADPAGLDRSGTLLAYSALAPGSRAQVRERFPLPLLPWLERLATSGVGKHAAVDAVLALERAAALADRAPEQALELLAPHEKVLRSLTEARQVFEIARARRAALRHDAARRQLDDARAALSRGALADAQRALDACDKAVLAAPERDETEALRAALVEVEATRAREARFEVATSRRDLLAARDAARELAEHAGTPDREHWARQHRRLGEEVRAAWHTRLVAEPGLDQAVAVDLPHEGKLPLLTDDATELLLFTARWHWLFVQRIDVATGRVAAALVLRTPEPLGGVAAAWLDGPSAVVVGFEPWLLQLSWRDGEVLRWRTLEDLVPPGEPIQRVWPVPGTPWLWIESGDEPPWNVWVADFERGRLRRRVRGTSCLSPVLGPGEPRMVLARNEDTEATLFSARGEPLGRLPVVTRLSDAAVHPRGRGLVVFDAIHGDLTEEQEEDEEEDDDPQLVLAEVDAGQTTRTAVVIDGSSEQMLHCLATSLDQGLTFCTYARSDGGWELAAFSAASGSLQALYRVALASWASLAQDAASRRVVLVRETGRGLEIVLLGPSPPTLDDRPGPAATLLPSLGPNFDCDARVDPSEEERDLAAKLRRMTDAEAQAWVRVFRDEHAADAISLLALLGALRRWSRGDWRDLGRFIQDRHGDHPAATATCAGLAAEFGEWERVELITRRAERTQVPAADLPHLLHLQGVALLRRGDVEGAGRAWSEASRAGAQLCNLEACLELVACLREPTLGQAPDAPAVVQLVSATVKADAALARNDPAAALAAIDCGVVWRMRERQSLARLAESHLRLEQTGAGPWLRKALAVATFCERQLGSRLHREDLVVPGATWEVARLDDLGRRCREWLDASSPCDPAGSPAR